MPVEVFSECAQRLKCGEFISSIATVHVLANMQGVGFDTSTKRDCKTRYLQHREQIFLSVPSGNLVYVGAGRHTVLPIMIMVLFQIPVYLGLALTWKQLKPKHSKDKEIQGTLDDIDKEFNTTTRTEASEVQSSNIAKEDKECELRFDAQLEETYQMRFVRLETES